MSENSWPIPATVKDALEAWDKDAPILTLEMSGTGPAIEQGIHIGVFEVIRHFLNTPPLSSVAREAYPQIEETLAKIDKEKGLDLTGPQIAAVRSLVFHFFMYGYASTVKTYNNKRRILVSRKFPTPKAA